MDPTLSIYILHWDFGPPARWEKTGNERNHLEGSHALIRALSLSQVAYDLMTGDRYHHVEFKTQR